MQDKISADLALYPRWLITMEGEQHCLENHAVIVAGSRIVDVCPAELAHAKYACTAVEYLPNHALLPGLINLHTHAAMSLLRGIADDLPLMRWLQEAIWPAEARLVSEQFVRDGTLLAAAEMLRGGVTTCNEMYFFPDAAAAAFDRAGMRAVVGITVLDFPTPYAQGPDEYLERGLAARENWAEHPLLHFSLAPHAPYTVSDASFERITALAGELDAPIHIHVHETAHEIEESLKIHGVRPLARLARLHLLGPGVTCVHSVHIEADEIRLLAAEGAAVAHCPTSNMKLASGIAPVAAMLEAGIPVGLGTDGCASNNRLDLFSEMRQAALLAKVATGDAGVLPAYRAFRMATTDAAVALGMDDRIGSIRIGKQADLCAVDLGSPWTQPCYDPISHLVYVAGRDQVDHVWVAGQPRVRNGRLLQIGHNELLALSALWHTKSAS